MGWMRERRLRTGLIALAALGLMAVEAGAVVTTERSASILIFAKLIANGSFDTVIQISNRSNSVVYGHCFYVNASPQDPTQPPGPSNPRQWQETDFDIVLTKQQPTHWVLSVGRVTNPFDASCSREGICLGGPNDGDPCGVGLSTDCSPGGGLCSNVICNDAGFDPGRVPPVSPGFEGELKCIEVDQSGAPINGNNLKGEATIVSLNADDLQVGDASKYNAIGILGLNDNDSDTVLCLGGQASASCPFGPEYDGCPDQVLMSHYADGATDPVAEEFGVAPSSVTTELTIVPCTENFETQRTTQLRINFSVYDEFENFFSASTRVQCWDNFTLESINRAVFAVGNALGSRFAQTKMVSPPGDSGFIGVMEEFHSAEDAPTSRAAENLFVIGERASGDLITIPEGQ